MRNLAAWIEFNPPVSLEKGKDYPFVGMDQIQPGIRYVKANTQRNFPSGGTRFRHGDTLFARITPCLENGKIAQFIAEAEVCGFGSTEFFVLRAKENIADPAFVYYLAKTDLLRGTAIRSMVGASGRQRADVESLRQLEIDLPDLPTQQAIGKVLAYYDDLLETNRSRIALLEESARLLYREWFVKLRFPGYELVKVMDGVPEGWSQNKLDAALFLQRGFDLPSAERKNGEIPIYASTGINGYHHEAKVSGPGVVTGRSGTLGVVNFVFGDYWPLNTSLWVKEFRSVTPIMAYFMLSELNLAQYNSGASVPTLDRKVVHQVEVLIPEPKIMAKFDTLVMPMFEQIRILNESNAMLAEARDKLLPKLMSGAIQV